MEEQNFLREIANDVQTPKNKRQQNTDGLFETTDCSHPDHQCTCGDEQMTLIEDQCSKYLRIVVTQISASRKNE